MEKYFLNFKNCIIEHFDLTIFACRFQLNNSFKIRYDEYVKLEDEESTKKFKQPNERGPTTSYVPINNQVCHLLVRIQSNQSVKSKQNKNR